MSFTRSANKLPNKIKDERIQKSTSQINAPMYYIILILTTISLTMKIALQLNPLTYVLEIIALISSLTYYTLSLTRKNMLFIKETDEVITDIKNSIKSNSYELCIIIFIVGQTILFISWFIYPLIPIQQVLSILSYTVMVVITSSYTSSKLTKKGLLVTWRSEKEKITIIKNQKIFSTVYSTVSIIILVVGIYLGHIGYISPNWSSTIIGVALGSCIIPVILFFNFKKTVLLNEKNANKEVTLAENSIEDKDETEIEA
ncbi:MAG: hypothetical protein LBE76_05960 [Nitrososphaerota archaeon]|jgi:hypothetical protein|nr:hypothetical protein [Nitrososphaerota archaeon]